MGGVGGDERKDDGSGPGDARSSRKFSVAVSRISPVRYGARRQLPHPLGRRTHGMAWGHEGTLTGPGHRQPLASGRMSSSWAIDRHSWPS